MAKKRGQGDGTISKRMVNGVWDGTWWARITVGKDENGKQKRKAFYGKTRNEVKNKLTEALNAVNNDTYIEPSSMTVAQWMDIWLVEYKKRSLKPNSYRLLCYASNYHIKPSLGKYKIKDLRGDTAQKFINNLTDKGLSPSSIKRIYSTLFGALQRAVDNELITKNIAVKLILPNAQKRRTRALTPEEQKRFTSIVKNKCGGEVFILALATGLRIGEILALTWDDVDFEKETLFVNKTLINFKDFDEKDSKWHNEVGTPKTKSSSRNMPLLPEIIKLLKNIKLEQLEKILKLGSAYEKNNLIFCNQLGGYLNSSNIRWKFRQVAKKADIEGCSIHSLRHSFATRCLESGIELRVVQEFMGHSSIKMTADLYTHVLEDQKRDSIMKLRNTINI